MFEQGDVPLLSLAGISSVGFDLLLPQDNNYNNSSSNNNNNNTSTSNSYFTTGLYDILPNWTSIISSTDESINDRIAARRVRAALCVLVAESTCQLNLQREEDLLRQRGYYIPTLKWDPTTNPMEAFDEVCVDSHQQRVLRCGAGGMSRALRQWRRQEQHRKQEMQQSRQQQQHKQQQQQQQQKQQQHQHLQASHVDSFVRPSTAPEARRYNKENIPRRQGRASGRRKSKRRRKQPKIKRSCNNNKINNKINNNNTVKAPSTSAVVHTTTTTTTTSTQQDAVLATPCRQQRIDNTIEQLAAALQHEQQQQNTKHSTTTTTMRKMKQRNKQLNDAAMLLQSCWRRYYSARWTGIFKFEVDTIRNWAAQCIQQWWTTTTIASRYRQHVDNVVEDVVDVDAVVVDAGVDEIQIPMDPQPTYSLSLTGQQLQQQQQHHQQQQLQQLKMLKPEVYAACATGGGDPDVTWECICNYPNDVLATSLDRTIRAAAQCAIQLIESDVDVVGATTDMLHVVYVVGATTDMLNVVDVVEEFSEEEFDDISVEYPNNVMKASADDMLLVDNSTQQQQQQQQQQDLLLNPINTDCTNELPANCNLSASATIEPLQPGHRSTDKQINNNNDNDDNNNNNASQMDDTVASQRDNNNNYVDDVVHLLPISSESVGPSQTSSTSQYDDDNFEDDDDNINNNDNNNSDEVNNNNDNNNSNCECVRDPPADVSITHFRNGSMSEISSSSRSDYDDDFDSSSCSDDTSATTTTTAAAAAATTTTTASPNTNISVASNTSSVTSSDTVHTRAGVMRAIRGTVQGYSGWYTQNKHEFLFEVDEHNNWMLLDMKQADNQIEVSFGDVSVIGNLMVLLLLLLLLMMMLLL